MENGNKYQTDPNVQRAVNAAFAEEKERKKKKRLIILGVVAAVIAFLLFIDSIGGSDENKSTQNNPSENTPQTVNAVQENKKDDIIGDFGCKVKSAKLCKDYRGKNSVLITYEFTNNADDAVSFDTALDDNVYQDGVELETAILDEDTDLFDVSVKPGVTKEVKKAYVLRDDSTPLEVEIEELFSFNDDKITTTVNITK